MKEAFVMKKTNSFNIRVLLHAHVGVSGVFFLWLTGGASLQQTNQNETRDSEGSATCRAR